VYEFGFECESCKKEYRFREGKFSEILKERDTVAELTAMHNAEIDSALNRRCPECGGPLKNGNGYGFLTCQWCYALYVVRDGELVPRPPEPKRKLTLKEVTNAVRTQW
jgi:hypothetical protein